VVIVQTVHLKVGYTCYLVRRANRSRWVHNCLRSLRPPIPLHADVFHRAKWNQKTKPNHKMARGQSRSIARS